MTSNDKVSLDITIGVVVISIGAIIYIGRILYKRKRKRKNLEKVLDPLVELEEIDIKPKKTAADHLGELKEVTQKVLQPLRKSSSYSSPKENLSSNFSSGRNSTSSSKTNIYDSILPFTFKLFKVPPPPPPTPLRSDDIRVDPIRISLLNLLLIDESENTLELDLTAPSESSSKKDLSRKMSQPNLNLTNSKKVLPRKISQPELNLSNSKNDLSRKISQSDLNLTNSKNDLSRKISQPDLNLTNSKKDLSRKVSQPDLNSLPRKMSQPDLNPTNSKKDLSRKMSQSDLNLTNSKKDLPRITWSQQIHPPTTHSKKDLLPQLDSSEIRSRNVSSTVPQLDSIIPSESRLKREITRTKPKLDSKVRSRRSHRRKYSRRKETNDYTNFQPIQNIKPIQNAQSEKRIIVETKEVGELTLSSMYSKVKTVLKENQDDEIILDANK